MKAGWEERPLGEICAFQGGTQPPKSQFVDKPREGYVRLLQIRDFKSDDRAVYVADNGKVKKCEASDIMIGRYGASVGQIHRGKAGAYNVALVKTIPDHTKLDRDFFYHFLTSDLFQKPLLEKSSRGAQNGFNQGDIAPFQVPLPPLEEQQRIVAVLDEAFEGLARARAHAEANLQNARELFEIRRAQIFSDDAEGEDVALGDICTKFEYGTAAKSQPEGNMPVLRMGNLQDGEIDWSDLVYSDDPNDCERYALKVGDVLFNRTNSPAHVGKTSIFDGKMPSIFAGYLIRVTPDQERLTPQFLNHFLNSDVARRYGRTVMGTSVNQANISGGKLKKYKIRVPSLEAQKQHVETLDALKAKVKPLQRAYRANLQDLDDLRQSLLQKAFAGELT